ncbi:MAG: aminodeoxychorismate/anthranilate synthase component I [Ignavibacteria bacterium]|nr:MAG: aminodeoxychorismate/anthranilate synthase component I [Ignavibacteria bacterium]
MNIHDMISGLRCTVQTRPLSPMSSEAFAGHARAIADGDPHIILLSGEKHVCSRRSLAFLRPAAILTVKNGTAHFDSAHGSMTGTDDPFELLSAAQRQLSASVGELTAGIAGYVAYEAAHAIEDFPSTVEDALDLPDLLFLWPTIILLRDHADGAVKLVEVSWTSDGKTLARLDAESGDPAGAPKSAYREEQQRVQPTGLRRSASREEYENAVAAVRRHIYEGDAYQVNLSQRFSFPLREDPFSLWMKMFAHNPAPFFAYVDAGSHQVISTSMERLFLIDGEMLESRPIKGTRPRGCDGHEDAALAEELRRSVKDDAELSMIVDLVRNDCSRVCEAGSVAVAEHRRLERYTNVQHLVSVVRGRLRDKTDIAKVFRALFPGGSITGCPKIRSMGIIDALEKDTRHVYTGSIGYIASDGRADFSIAIRTAVVKNCVCHLSVGGGIVYDSDPAEEYIETLHKGGTFFRLAGINTE